MLRFRAITAFMGALVAVVVAVSVSTAGSGLVTRSSKAAGFTLPVPAAWVYKNLTYPSDHSFERWADPADAKSKLEVQVSGCVGCVEPSSCTLRNVGCGPAPEGVLPKGTISRRKIGKWKELFVARDPKSPYLIHGLVSIQHQGAEIEDWAYVEIWIPAAQAATADAMLAGFAFA